MPKFPYVHYPFPFYRNQTRNKANYYNFPHRHINANYKNNSASSTLTNNNFSTFENKNLNESEIITNSDKKNKSNKNTIDYLFDLFGLKIYSDDVLLVSLLYFLYSEGVKDDGLFLVLILLLIS